MEKDSKIKYGDLHQMFAYQAKAQAPGLLIYPDDGRELPKKYEFQVGQMTEPLFTLKLNISEDGYKQIKERIDRRLKKSLTKLLPNTTPSKTTV